jgi:hypothetical protein
VKAVRPWNALEDPILYRSRNWIASQATMNQTKFPKGWDEKRVAKVLNHHHEQTEDEAVAEDEAGVRPGETAMRAPHALAPLVRELIAKRKTR